MVINQITQVVNETMLLNLHNDEVKGTRVTSDLQPHFKVFSDVMTHDGDDGL